ncbi:MAG: sodium/proline symporter, partial [Pseudomonadota bacterium]
IVTLIIGVIALIFAAGEAKFIFWFVLFAWSGLGAAFGPPILCALYFKRTTLAGAIAGMLGGFGTAVVWIVFFKAQTHDLYEMIPAFLVGMTLTVGVSLMTGGRPPLPVGEGLGVRDNT